MRILGTALCQLYRTSHARNGRTVPRCGRVLALLAAANPGNASANPHACRTLAAHACPVALRDEAKIVSPPGLRNASEDQLK
jgi:hypothetical protein